MPNTEANMHSKAIHVAAGVIVNANNEVCLSLRDKDAHQGGLWEFPGGKLEADETAQEALQRELQEELGIEIDAAEPLTTIDHDYGDKKVVLDFMLVTQFSGEPVGKEGQQVKWLPISDLDTVNFPAANQPVVKLLLSIYCN